MLQYNTMLHQVSKTHTSENLLELSSIHDTFTEKKIGIDPDFFWHIYGTLRDTERFMLETIDDMKHTDDKYQEALYISDNTSSIINSFFEIVQILKEDK